MDTKIQDRGKIKGNNNMKNLMDKYLVEAANLDIFEEEEAEAIIKDIISDLKRINRLGLKDVVRSLRDIKSSLDMVYKFYNKL